jgi:hypothetical protein
MRLRHSETSGWFKRSTVYRRAVDVLRTATEPMTAREIAERVLAAANVKRPDRIPARTSATKCLLKQNLIAELKLPSHLVFAPSNLETKMKFALIGATAVAAAAFVTPALAQAVISDPGYCAQFYPNANCQNLGPGNPYTDGGYYRDGNWQNGNAQTAEPDAYRYHGGPKSND